MRHLFLFAALLCIAAPGAWAGGPAGGSLQNIQGISGGVPVPVTNSSGTAVACQGGTGSAVTSVTATPTEICAGTSGVRSFFHIVGTPGDTAIGYCSWLSTSPSASTADFQIGQNQGYDSTGMLMIPNNPIWCVAASATVTISASAIQATSP
jgi:hypothetical protein